MEKAFKISLETKEQILKRVEEGLPVNKVVEEHGISPNTIYPKPAHLLKCIRRH